MRKVSDEAPMAKKRYQAKIRGKKFSIVSDKETAHMNRVTEQFNQWLDEASRQYPSGSTENLALLVGMNITSDLLELKQAHYALYHSEQQALQENQRLKASLDTKQQECLALKAANDELRDRLSAVTAQATSALAAKTAKTATLEASSPTAKSSLATEATDQQAATTTHRTEQQAPHTPTDPALKTQAAPKASATAPTAHQAVTKPATSAASDRPKDIEETVYVDVDSGAVTTLNGAAKGSLFNPYRSTEQLLAHRQQQKQRVQKHLTGHQGLAKTPRH